MSFEGELAPSFTLHCLSAGRTLSDGWGLGYYPAVRAVHQGCAMASAACGVVVAADGYGDMRRSPLSSAAPMISSASRTNTVGSPPTIVNIARLASTQARAPGSQASNASCRASPRAIGSAISRNPEIAS
ncbi:MAG: hypothetical protein H0T89_26400 [Deltaproteobacteria bacterium]|nr:hypothetical protein [Deltaproteobacteria bacterium]